LPKITSTTVEALVLAEALGLEMKPRTQMLSNSAGTSKGACMDGDLWSQEGVGKPVQHQLSNPARQGAVKNAVPERGAGSHFLVHQWCPVNCVHVVVACMWCHCLEDTPAAALHRM
jgi:hypothetical protein